MKRRSPSEAIAKARERAARATRPTQSQQTEPTSASRHCHHASQATKGPFLNKARGTPHVKKYQGRHMAPATTRRKPVGTHVQSKTKPWSRPERSGAPLLRGQTSGARQSALKPWKAQIRTMACHASVAGKSNHSKRRRMAQKSSTLNSCMNNTSEVVKMKAEMLKRPTQRTSAVSTVPSDLIHACIDPSSRRWMKKSCTRRPNNWLPLKKRRQRAQRGAEPKKAWPWFPGCSNGCRSDGSGCNPASDLHADAITARRQPGLGPAPGAGPQARWVGGRYSLE
mmetsp:Transcript_129698/g.289176  ORF Transcript_129698/g.289176 Transcript_129698/m.289176 type:complete len:282 (-) Transcript_129698:65-910(-)